jgi:reactive intermediate/imine deaminase
MATKTFLNPAALKPIPAPVSHGVAASGQRTVYVSGQVAVDKDGKVVGSGNITEQTHQVMRNIQAVLAQDGAAFADVVKLTMYLVNMADLPAVIQVRSQYLGENKPAATAVGITALARPEFLVEIEAVAVTG